MKLGASPDTCQAEVPQTEPPHLPPDPSARSLISLSLALSKSMLLAVETDTREESALWGLLGLLLINFQGGRFHHLPFFRAMHRGEWKAFPLLK